MLHQKPAALTLRGFSRVGSTREEIQHWELNLVEKTAHQSIRGFRQLTPMAERVTQDDMAALAKGVCSDIQKGYGSKVKSGADLTWVGEAEFRVKPSSLTPGDGFRRTIEGRRKKEINSEARN
jgi:hypothetical protein